MPDGPVVTLDISVLLGLSGLDVVQGNALLLGPDGVVAEVSGGASSPFSLLVQATRSISAVPSALKRFMGAMRMWISAVWRSGSRDAILSPKAFKHRIFASTRLRA